MENLTGKGKHTVNVGNHLHTTMISKPAIVRRGEYKCKILEMHLKWKDQQLKTILFIYLFLKYLFFYLTALSLSWGMWTLSCAMWDLVPWQVIESGPSPLGAWSLSHWTTREVPRSIKIKYSPDHKGSQELNYEGKKKKELTRHRFRIMLPGSPEGKKRRLQGGFTN